MKFLLVLAAVVFGIWLWKQDRRTSRTASSQAPASPHKPHQPPVEMRACKRCGVLVPDLELVTGITGVYCSEAHRAASEN